MTPQATASYTVYTQPVIQSAKTGQAVKHANSNPKGLQQGNARLAREWPVAGTYRTPSLRTYSSFSAKPFFWKTAMTALWMLQRDRHQPASALVGSFAFPAACGRRCLPVPGGVGSRPLLLLPSVLWRTFLALPQLAETGRAHQLEPMQSPHGGDMERQRDTLSRGQQEKKVRL